VREFARLGAEVLVNISDDGWYGDTSAPWQHLNMARMRAIENRRWILRDFRGDVTFYTAHGDVFAWLCVLLSFVVVAWSGRKLLRQWVAVGSNGFERARLQSLPERRRRVPQDEATLLPILAED
jgi:hypothetical protein